MRSEASIRFVLYHVTSRHVTISQLVISGGFAETSGVGTGSWKRLTKSAVAAWILGKKPKSSRNENADNDEGDMDDTQSIESGAPNGALAFIEEEKVVFSRVSRGIGGCTERA